MLKLSLQTIMGISIKAVWEFRGGREIKKISLDKSMEEVLFDEVSFCIFDRGNNFKVVSYRKPSFQAQIVKKYRQFSAKVSRSRYPLDPCFKSS